MLERESPGVLMLLIPLEFWLERDFPQFASTLKTNIFQKGEDVTNNDGDTAEVFEWDIDSKYLVIESANDFEVGEMSPHNKLVVKE